MVPSLGIDIATLGPATQDGLGPHDPAFSQASLELVAKMLEHLGKFAQDGVEAMQLERFWHPNFCWYGPAGIGTTRGIKGFRQWHQIPFLRAMPDRISGLGMSNLFGNGKYVAFTEWPGMRATISGDGWLGIAPANQAITLRSLDFWRCEAGKIRENWVLVDLLDIYQQIGIDVLARMRTSKADQQL
ncbi:MAG: ester cyclase [Pseudomonadota bacterium]